MRTAANIYVRVGIPLGSLVVYVLAFFTLYPLAGPAAAALVILPIVITGWYLGIRGGLLAGILTFFLNSFRFIIMKDPVAGDILPNTLVCTAFTLIGMAVGWTSELLQRVNQQAAELRDERR